MSTSAALQDLVEAWLRLDQNNTTRNEISRLWEARNDTELEKRLRNRIEFGTAGTGLIFLFYSVIFSNTVSKSFHGTVQVFEAAWKLGFLA